MGRPYTTYMVRALQELNISDIGFNYTEYMDWGKAESQLFHIVWASNLLNKVMGPEPGWRRCTLSRRCPAASITTSSSSQAPRPLNSSQDNRSLIHHLTSLIQSVILRQQVTHPPSHNSHPICHLKAAVHSSTISQVSSLYSNFHGSMFSSTPLQVSFNLLS